MAFYVPICMFFSGKILPVGAIILDESHLIFGVQPKEGLCRSGHWTPAASGAGALAGDVSRLNPGNVPAECACFLQSDNPKIVHLASTGRKDVMQRSMEGSSVTGVH